MSNSRKYAERELNIAKINGETRRAVLELFDKFSKEGHSGFSANLCIFLFKKLVNRKPLIENNKVDSKLPLVDFAEQSLREAGLFDEDSDYSGMMGQATLDLIKIYSKYQDDGTILDVFTKLALFEPLTPLTFESWEWNETGDGVYQNSRNYAVFKDGKNGRPYYIDAYYMDAGEKGTWSGSLEIEGNKRIAKCYIKDPSNMPQIRIPVETVETGPKDSDFEILPVPESAISELRNYYDVEIKQM